MVETDEVSRGGGGGGLTDEGCSDRRACEFRPTLEISTFLASARSLGQGVLDSYYLPLTQPPSLLYVHPNCAPCPRVPSSGSPRI